MSLAVRYFLLCLIVHSFTLSSQDYDYPYHFNSIEDRAIDQLNSDTFGQNLGWTIFKDIMFPGTTISGSMKHLRRQFPNKQVLSCKIRGGDAYNNIFYTYTFAKSDKRKEWTFTHANEFEYHLDFFVESKINCDTPNKSELEGLEFTFQIAKPPVSYLWGLQWSKENVWCYWDDTKKDGKTKGWVKIPHIKLCIKHHAWNKIHITGYRTNLGLYYDSMTLNGEKILLNIFVPKAYLPNSWGDNYLQIGFQINGNKAIRRDHSQKIDPASVYLDNLDVKVGRR